MQASTRSKIILLFLMLVLVAAPGCSLQFLSQQPESEAGASTRLIIADIADNRGGYPNSQVPQYGKLEITFQISNTVATNFQFPYDPSPPGGVDPADPAYNGISVDALFTPDNWKTIYTQPAFYYQGFEEQVKVDKGKPRDWLYPTDQFAWVVRFSPPGSGKWQYRLRAQDINGQVETQPVEFTVASSADKGFVKVSQADRRYFEFSDGSLFSGLGFNVPANLDNPTSANAETFGRYQENGIQLLRVWISSIYGSAWSPYNGGRNQYNGYLPRTGLDVYTDPVRGKRIVLHVDYEVDGDTGWFDACYLHWGKDAEAIKPNTDYRITVKYRGVGIRGPRDAAHPDYGLVVKLGGFHNDCYQPGTSQVVTGYGKTNTDWGVIEGVWNSGENAFLPNLHLALENVTQGRAYIEFISIQEELGDIARGPEVLTKPIMAQHEYFPQRSSYALDKLVDLAERHDLYLKLVVLEKEDEIFFKINDDGSFLGGEDKDNLDGFYGLGRVVNKTRWLQQAWWRYLQARWGYSTHIHSWELTNEGNPGNPNHYILADEFGKYLHCRVFGVKVAAEDGRRCEYQHPNAHLVTTSFWRFFPAAEFWANPSYPNLDYADFHAYIRTGWLREPLHESDSARYHLDYAAQTRKQLGELVQQNKVDSMPILRGEAGINFLNKQNENPDLARDTRGVWLHNLIWAGLHPGGLYELYWWGENISKQPGPDGKPGLYEIYRYYNNFIQDIPLNNGQYQSLQASVSNPSLRLTGQIDLENQRAHMWVQNKAHTWRNVVDGTANIAGIKGEIKFSGFQPNATLKVEWHAFTTQGTPSIRTSTVKADGSGTVTLTLPDNPQLTDVGIKLEAIQDP